MKTIAYFISDYGYGHASRSIALIRILLKKRQNVQVVICHSFCIPFIQDSLKEYSDRITFREVKTDVGYVLKENSLDIDQKELEIQCNQFLKDVPERIQQETEFLRSYDICGIVSDISPLAFPIAKELDVLSIGISNFTWYTAYLDLVSETVRDELLLLYIGMDFYYSLAGSKEMKWGEKATRCFQYFCREIDQKEVNRWKRVLNPSGDKPIVFIPIGLKIDLKQLQNLKLWDRDMKFIVSSNMLIHHPHVYQIPGDYNEVQNVAAAADVIISKAGWGIVSEAVTSGKPLFIINRSELQEERNTVKELLKHNLATLFQLKDIDSLDWSQEVKHDKKGQVNEAEAIVQWIVKDLGL